MSTLEELEKRHKELTLQEIEIDNEKIEIQRQIKALSDENASKYLFKYYKYEALNITKYVYVTEANPCYPSTANWTLSGPSFLIFKSSKDFSFKCGKDNGGIEIYDIERSNICKEITKKEYLEALKEYTNKMLEIEETNNN